MKSFKQMYHGFRRIVWGLPKNERLILNEAVNFEKEVIFIAIPKTGTTSVRRQMQQEGTPLISNPHLSITQVRDSIYVYLLMRSLGCNKVFPTIAVPTDRELRDRARAVFEGFFKFAAVRNPWARAVSLYYRREGIQVRKRISFEEFCVNHVYASDTCVHPTLHRNQIDWLCDENGNCLMDYIYKVEEFDIAMNEIFERTNGRICFKKTKANKNPRSRSEQYRELYTERTKKLIAKRFEKDIDYFKYTF